MIKTFLANNGNTVKTGMAETQPVKRNGSQEELVNNIQLQGLIQNQDAGTFQPVTNSSLPSIKKDFLNPNFVLSTLKGNSINRINSNFELNIGNETFIKNIEDISNATKSFSFYENLTGLSQERPEIIMMTDFQPIYFSEKFNNELFRLAYKPFSPRLTDAGHFFEHQLNIRKLKSHNIKHIVSFNKVKSSQFSSVLVDRKSKFSSAIDDATSTITFLYNIVKVTELMKNQLDARDKVHIVDPYLVFKTFVTENSQIFSEERLEHMSNAFQQSFGDKFDITQVMNEFEFNSNIVKSGFTSTKIWLQLLLETKEVLKSHSFSMFDIRSDQHETDSNATKLLKTPGIKRFSIVRLKNDPPPLQEIINLPEPQLNEVTQKIISSYKEIYENIHFKNEEIRISALINALSKELKYSSALDSKDVKSALKTYFNYDVSPRGNDGVLDVILGDLGEHIGDAPSSNALNNSLASIFQIKESNSIILPFESRPVEADSGNLKPGSEVYVESVVKTDGKKFNTAKLKEFSGILSKAEKSFSLVANKFNFLSLSYENESAYNNSQQTAKVDNPKILLDSFLADLIDGGKPTQLLKDDAASAVFSLARFDEKIRTLLFLYTITLNQASKSTLENQLIEAIQENLKRVPIEQLASSIKESFSLWDMSKKIEYVRALGLSNSKLISKVKEKFSSLKLADMPYTSYGGHIDTVIGMVVFDIIISIIYNFGAKNLLGFTLKENQQMFVMQTKMNENNSSSINEVYSRINKEVSIVQRSTLLFLNTLKKLQYTIGNIINFVDSKESLAIIKKLSGFLGDNVDLLNLLFDKHQIELISSYVSDLSFNLKNIDLDQQKDDIKLLDEFTVGPNLKKGLEEFFFNEQFSSARSKNQKILSVGIPLGFVSNFRKKVDVFKTKKAAQDERQNDVIKIKLYKIDLQSPDVVYRPKEFLFELSRFPVRNDDLIKPFTEGQSKNIHEISRHFSTRDYSQIFSPTGAQVQYLQSQNNEIEALSGKDYSFLNEKKKKQLYSNHIMSYALECYLKIMTGISTADHQFNLTPAESNFEPAFLENFLNYHLNNFALEKQTSAVNTSTTQQVKLFNGTYPRTGSDKKSNVTSNVNGYSTIEALSHYENTEKKTQVILDTSQINFSGKDVPAISHQISVLNEVSRTLTDISSPDLILKRVFYPKRFDRIFNIIFDPYTFEIDLESTNSTPHGKVALQMMVNRGDILLENSPMMTFLGSGIKKESYVYRERNKSQGELLMEKYFVAIETIDEEEN